MTENLQKEILRYPLWKNENVEKQLDRYKGWMLIGNEATKEANTAQGHTFLLQNNFVPIDWSSLSGDSDDKGDVAICKY